MQPDPVPSLLVLCLVLLDNKSGSEHYQKWYEGRLLQSMVGSWYCFDRIVPKGISQVWRRSEVGNHKQRTGFRWSLVEWIFYAPFDTMSIAQLSRPFESRNIPEIYSLWMYSLCVFPSLLIQLNPRAQNVSRPWKELHWRYKSELRYIYTYIYIYVCMYRYIYMYVHIYCIIVQFSRVGYNFWLYGFWGFQTSSSHFDFVTAPTKCC